MTYLFAVLLLASSATTASDSSCVKDPYGNVVCGKGECVADQYKQVFCSPQGGSAVKDQYGQVVCGAGRCVEDSVGKIWCSKEPGGGAALDLYKQAKCLGGCELATAERCELPQ